MLYRLICCLSFTAMFSTLSSAQSPYQLESPGRKPLGLLGAIPGKAAAAGFAGDRDRRVSPEETAARPHARYLEMAMAEPDGLIVVYRASADVRKTGKAGVTAWVKQRTNGRVAAAHIGRDGLTWYLVRSDTGPALFTAPDAPAKAAGIVAIAPN